MVKRLYQKGITANQVTLFACAVSILIGLLLALFAGVSTLFWLLPIWLFVRMALNAMDGMLAREFGQQSALGGYLNEITDIAADLGQVHGNGRRYDGPFGKSDRAFFIGALAVWYAIDGSFHSTFYILMWLACAALLYTCYKRVINGLKAV